MNSDEDGLLPCGGPLAWGSLIPRERLERLAASTRRALQGRPEPWIAPWLPAAAVAAAGLAAVWMVGPGRGAREVPTEVLDNLEFLEHLELLEDWERLRGRGPQARQRT